MAEPVAMSRVIMKRATESGFMKEEDFDHYTKIKLLQACIVAAGICNTMNDGAGEP